MSFQPDMIWQYAQFLKEVYNNKGYFDISIYVNSKVSLNGRPSKTYIDSNINLLNIKFVDDIYNYVSN